MATECYQVTYAALPAYSVHMCVEAPCLDMLSFSLNFDRHPGAASIPTRHPAAVFNNEDQFLSRTCY